MSSHADARRARYRARKRLPSPCYRRVFSFNLERMQRSKRSPASSWFSTNWVALLPQSLSLIARLRVTPEIGHAITSNYMPITWRQRFLTIQPLSKHSVSGTSTNIMIVARLDHRTRAQSAPFHDRLACEVLRRNSDCLWWHERIASGQPQTRFSLYWLLGSVRARQDPECGIATPTWQQARRCGRRHFVFRQHLEDIFRERLRSYEGSMDFTYLTDLDMPSLLERLKHLPEHTIVLYTHIGMDARGTRYISASEAGPMVVGAANAPVFGPSDVDLGHGRVRRVSGKFRHGR